jgi:diguanylate cyclase (GGDEF)-like protein
MRADQDLTATRVNGGSVEGLQAAPHPLRTDPVLRLTVGAGALLAVVLVIDVSDDLLRGLLSWVPSVALTAGAAVSATSAARQLGTHPARRFWWAMAMGMALLTIGNAAQTVAVIRAPSSPVPVTYTPALTAAVGLCLALLLLMMITYPMPFESRLSRGRYWLDLSTVLTVSVAFGVFFAAAQPDIVGSDGLLIVGRLVSGPVMQFLTVFGVGRMLLSPAPPFTRAAGVLGGLGVGTSAFGTGVAPALQAPEHQHWFLLIELVTNVFVLSCSRAQQLGVHGGKLEVRSRDRTWSVLPYLAILAVYGLLVASLQPLGLSLSHWTVVCAATLATGLVVVRQLASFADIQRLLRERDSLVDRLQHQAYHDGLTGLGNRALFFSRLETELVRRRHDGHQVAVLLVDLDDFKPINDKFGHDAGDAILVECAQRIVSSVREEDLVARLGGDEFAVVLGDTDPAAVHGVSARVVEALSRPVPFGGRTLGVGCSIGAAVGSHGSHGANELVKAADEAMYEAKARGKGGFVVVE